MRAARQLWRHAALAVPHMPPRPALVAAGTLGAPLATRWAGLAATQWAAAWQHRQGYATDATKGLSARRLQRTAQELGQQLGQQAAMEQQSYSEPPELEAFLERGPWAMVQEPGDREVRLVAQLANERITARVALMDPEAGEEELAAVPVDVLVSKQTGHADHGTLVFELMVYRGDFEIDQIYLETDSRAADPQTVDEARVRGQCYPGPLPAELDPDLQQRFREYLQARHIDADFCAFVELLYNSKEQREYMRWLADVSGFLAK